MNNSFQLSGHFWFARAIHISYFTPLHSARAYYCTTIYQFDTPPKRPEHKLKFALDGSQSCFYVRRVVACSEGNSIIVHIIISIIHLMA